MTRELWDARAALGDQAGTQDRIAKVLAMRELRRHIHIGQTVLDVGCGNGQTIEYLLNWEPTLKIIGIDFSPAMIAAARERCGVTAVFSAWDLLSALPIPTFPGGADIAITERVIVNLPDWDTQAAVIRRILDAVKPGGLYLMIENSLNGTQEINFERWRYNLPSILPPSHNLYMLDRQVEGLEGYCGADLVEIRSFSGLYYLLSRVVNARIAADLGTEPDYNSPLNRLALDLPTTSFPALAQGKLWVWRKHE